MIRSLHLFAALGCLALFACADRSPLIVEVDRLRAVDDPSGPYVISARVQPGDPPMRVELRYTLRDIDPIDFDCVAGMVSSEPDSGPEPSGSPCRRLALRADGSIWRGTLLGPPFPGGSRVLYRLVARDDDGDQSVWPADGPALFEVDAVPNRLALIDLAPQRGPASGGTEVVLRGADFAPGMTVRFGGQVAASRVLSAQQAVALTPPSGAGPADVEVIRDGVVARLPEVFVFDPPPVVDRLDPAEGPADAAILMVIEGSDFVDGATVGVGDGLPIAADWLSPDRLSVVIDPLPAGRYPIEVRNPDGQRATTRPVLTAWPPPVLDAIQPPLGADAGGAAVVVTGVDLRSPGALYFGRRPAPQVVVADDGLSAEVIAPLHPEGSVDVTWFNPDGQSASLPLAFRFIGPPAVDAAEPGVVGRCGGGRVRLVGRNFSPEMTVTIDGRPAEVLEVSDDGTEAVVRIPRGEVGAARLEITGPGGRVFRSDELLVYDRRPVIRVVEPSEVPIWGQDDVVVSGADLDATTAVRVGETPALGFTIVAGDDPCDGRLLLDVPPGEAGAVDLSVDDARGEATRLPEAVTYVAPTLEPDEGLVPGYTNVVLRGIGLSPDLSLTIGGRAPRRIERVSDELWRLVTPVGDAGAAEVRFALPGVGRAARLDDAYTYLQFQDRTNGRLEMPGDCNDLSVADLDGDGALDFAAAFGGMGDLQPTEQSPAVFFNDGSGRFRRQGLAPQGNGINVRAGDVDGDGDVDLLYANLSGPTNNLFINDGSGRFTDDRDFAGRDPSYDADLIDVDNDGDLDVVSVRIGTPEAGNASGPEQLWLNDGRGRFVDRSDQLPNNPRDVHDHDFAQGDLNGDGWVDLLIVVDNLSPNFQTARNRIWMNQGDGQFAFRDSPLNDIQADWLDIEVADLDGDGDLDVLMPQNYLEGFSFPGTPSLALYFNDGDANFEPGHERINGLSRLPAYEAVPVDLDNDGDLDIIVAVFGILYGDGTVEPFASSVLLNDGTARWFESNAAFGEVAVIPSTNFGVADLDSDGDLDLIECAGRGRSRLWMLE